MPAIKGLELYSTRSLPYTMNIFFGVVCQFLFLLFTIWFFFYFLSLFRSYFYRRIRILQTSYYYAVALVTQFFVCTPHTFCLFAMVVLWKIYATKSKNEQNGNVCLEEISKSSVCDGVFFVSFFLCRFIVCFMCNNTAKIRNISYNLMDLEWNNNDMKQRVFLLYTKSIFPLSEIFCCWILQKYN